MMLLVTSEADRVAPEILSVELPPTVKSCDAINQVPVWPKGAKVVMLAVSLMLTFAAEVSMKPPEPPVGALASMVPATSELPFCIPARSLIVPLTF